MNIKPGFILCTPEMIGIYNKYQLYFSKKFCEFTSSKIEEIFGQVGIKPSFKIGMSVGKQDNDRPMYISGQVSKLHFLFAILPRYEDNVSFCWRSKSGKIIKTTDEDFDETDLEYWMEGLKPQEYWKQIGGEKKEHPFKTDKLPFPVKVIDFNLNMHFNIHLSDIHSSQKITDALIETIDNYNKKSELKNRKDGVIHNMYPHTENEMLVCRLDLGSAGVKAVNQLLKVLGKFPEIKEIVLDY